MGLANWLTLLRHPAHPGVRDAAGLPEARRGAARVRRGGLHRHARRVGGARSGTRARSARSSTRWRTSSCSPRRSSRSPISRPCRSGSPPSSSAATSSWWSARCSIHMLGGRIRPRPTWAGKAAMFFQILAVLTALLARYLPGRAGPRPVLWLAAALHASSRGCSTSSRACAFLNARPPWSGRTPVKTPSIGESTGVAVAVVRAASAAAAAGLAGRRPDRWPSTATASGT